MIKVNTTQATTIIDGIMKIIPQGTYFVLSENGSNYEYLLDGKKETIDKTIIEKSLGIFQDGDVDAFLRDKFFKQLEIAINDKCKELFDSILTENLVPLKDWQERFLVEYVKLKIPNYEKIKNISNVKGGLASFFFKTDSTEVKTEWTPLFGHKPHLNFKPSI